MNHERNAQRRVSEKILRSLESVLVLKIFQKPVFIIFETFKFIRLFNPSCIFTEQTGKLRSILI